jgi:hypothetical protein
LIPLIKASAVPIGRYLVGQNSDPYQSKEVSIGKNFLSIPSAVGTWLAVSQKNTPKNKVHIRNKKLL